MIAIVMTGNVRDGMLSLNGIMLRRCLSLCAIVMACSIVAGGAVQDPRKIYDRSTDALYNLDFSIAQAGYETLTKEHPENPDYWNALASSIWLRITFSQQKLNIESFSGQGTFGTRESKDIVSPADERRFRDIL